MKNTAILAAFLTLASFPAALHAQMGPAPKIGGSQANNPLGVQETGLSSGRTAKGASSQANQMPPAASGGGLMHFKGIAISPVPNVPFSATVVTEWKRFLPDGSTQTTKSHQLVARDSSGRIFEEWRSLSPNGDKKETDLLATEFIDPARQTHYRCTNLQFKECQTLPFTAAAPAAATGKTASLGAKKIEDLDTTGTRETIVPATGEKEIVEAWFSPKLQINLMEKHASNDNLDFSVKSIALTEPDPKLFVLPGGYRVVAAR